MKTNNIKKITEFKAQEVKLYYIQIGTRMFSLSMPSNSSTEEVKAIMLEFIEKVDEAVQGESIHDAAYRALVNKTEAREVSAIDFSEETELEEAQQATEE